MPLAIKKKTFFFFSFFLLSSIVKASPITFNKGSKSCFNLETYVYLMVDSTRLCTIDSIIQDKRSRYIFYPMSRRNMNFGFTSSAYWIKISTNNNTNQDKTLFLSIGYPLLNSVIFYETDEHSTLRVIETGECKLFKSREINNRKFVFQLKTNAHESRSFYVRIYNDGETVRLPITLSMADTFNDSETHETFWVAVYYGFLFFGLIFNILLVLSFRQRMYVYFSVFVLATTLSLMILDGLAFQFFFPNSPWFANKSIIFISLLSNISIVLFTENFFLDEKKFTYIRLITNALLGYYAVLFFLIFLDYPRYLTVVKMANFTTAITGVAIFFLSVYSTIKNFKSSKLVFVGALLLVMLGTVFHISRNAGLIPDNFLSQNGLKLGFALQIVCLTFAIVIHFKMVLTETNAYLEQEVKQRTAEIEAQRDFLDEQKKQILKQNQLITDSIVYAQRIQTTALPDRQFLKEVFGDFLLLYQPKSIVSGDFYWVYCIGNKIVIAVVDCTGHGVPGGFLSMLGISFLNEVVVKDNELKPSYILDKLRNKVKNMLSNNDNENSLKDGMDISLCVIDRKMLKMEYACAYNPILIVRDDGIHELHTDRMPIGKHTKTEVAFKNFEIDLKHGDKIFMFTDGIIDQFGGPLTKKFSKERFKNLLISSNKDTLRKNKDEITRTLNKWKASNDQTDDILVFAFKI